MKYTRFSSYENKANKANWENARKIAQNKANEFGGKYFVFQEWNGSLTVSIDYPKDGTMFETFEPGRKI